jgi:hypothetical protein
MAQAQVYSVNIVGYINKGTTLPSQLLLVNNTLDDGTNTLRSQLGTAPVGCKAWVWNGAAYNSSEVTTKAGNQWNSNLPIPNGSGFFFQGPASLVTNTFVGQIKGKSGTSFTNELTGGIVDVTGAPLPIATTSIKTDAAYGLSTAPLGSKAWKWNGATYNSSEVTTKAGNQWNADFAVGVNEAIVIQPSSTFKWVQTLP